MTREYALSQLSPGYLDLRALALYSSCSVRWLRDRLVDPAAPLPHHRVEGKILVKKDDFDHWIASFRMVQSATEVDGMVTEVLSGLFGKKGS
jgi:hypothetical protein